MGLGAPLRADPAAEAMLRTLLTTPDPDPDQFTEAFRASVPMARLDELLDGLTKTVGDPQSVQVSGDRFTLETESHVVTGQIALDGAGRVALLFFDPPETQAADLGQALAGFAALGRDVAWLVTRDDVPLSEQGAETPMPVGSAFKLGVMAALLDEVASGGRDWADVLTLEAYHLSLPTGRVQNLPVGAPLTLHTLAAQMISESDNTATDMLMDALGRYTVADALGVDFVLTTREFFVLRGTPDLARAFKEGSGGDTLFADLEFAPLPAVADVLGPFDPEIEWSLPLSQLCALIEQVADHPVMAINPGPVDPELWETHAFKGGSESGVLNLTAFMTDAEGHRYCVAVTVNDPGEIDTSAAIAAHRSVARTLSVTN